MPRRDGTGPMGMGPMTGWGIGPCFGKTSGNRTGRGVRRPGKNLFCRGMRCLYDSNTDTDEREVLSRRAAALESRLHAIKQKLNELNTKN